jgi:hypothetical protein
MQAIVHAADVQDRDGGVLLMGALFGLYPFLLKLYADSGYTGQQFLSGLRQLAGKSIWKSSNAPNLTSSSSCQNAGLSSGPSAGSTAAVGWLRIGNASIAMRLLSYDGRPSVSRYESFVRSQYDPG